jgi:hypothetical protein
MTKFNKSELIAHVEYELALAGDEDARDVVATVIAYVIKALRADRSIAARTTLQWEGFFADASDRASSDLHRLSELIGPPEAVWAIEDFLDDRGTDDKPSAPQAGAEAGAS